MAMMALLFTSCKKWLDVKPEDKFIEEQLYSKPQGFADALNGFYIKNGADSMYGARLTMTTMDVLAQLYAVSSLNTHYAMATYKYGESNAMALIDGIWTNGYVNIANINKYLGSLDTYGSVLTEKVRNRYRGEALGLRAFYNFDLVRLFTPAYAKDSTSAVLPYYTSASAAISAYKPTNWILQQVLNDLTAAEQLLEKSDAAVSAAQVSAPSAALARTTRNYAMNYYAVKALKARIYMWMGDKPSALNAATGMMTVQHKFPWVTTADLNTPSTCNKIFSTEMIFGVENPKLPDVFNAVFNAALFDITLLAGNSSGTFINNTIFEGTPGDYRSQYSWKIAGKPYPTFFKYQDVSSTGLALNKTVPLLRMSEMYLIAAECEPDPKTALGYLNELRVHRNIAALPETTSPAQLTTAILKEYRREFYGEGQLFYFYKRRQAATIVAAGTNTSLTMKDSYYTFTKPLSETTPR